MNAREQVERALVNVLSNAMNYPDPTAMLGRDTAPLRGKIADVVLGLLADAWADGADAVESVIDTGGIIRNPYLDESHALGSAGCVCEEPCRYCKCEDTA